MKNRTNRAAVALLVSLSLFGLGHVSAQETPNQLKTTMDVVEQPAPSVNAKPALQFTRSKHDFGTAEQGKSIEIKFPFTNTSDKPIKITNVHTGCGCTAAKNNPDVVKPGESAEITVVFDTKGRSGKQNRTIQVYTDDPSHSVYPLDFEGNVVMDVYLSDQRVEFGDIEFGEGGKKTFSLVNFDKKPIKITSVSVNDPNLKVREASVEDYEELGRKGKRHIFEVVVPEDYPLADFRETITLETDHPSYPRHGLVAFGRVVGDSMVTPTRVYAIVNQNESADRNIQVMSRSGAAVEIESYEFDQPLEGVELTVKEGPTGDGSKMIVASFKGGEQPENRTANLVLKLRNAEKDRTEIVRVPFVTVVRSVPQKVQRELRPGGSDMLPVAPQLEAPHNEKKGS